MMRYLYISRTVSVRCATGREPWSWARTTSRLPWRKATSPSLTCCSPLMSTRAWTLRCCHHSSGLCWSLMRLTGSRVTSHWWASHSGYGVISWLNRSNHWLFGAFWLLDWSISLIRSFNQLRATWGILILRLHSPLMLLLLNLQAKIYIDFCND